MGVNTAGDIDNVGFSHRMVTASKQPRNTGRAGIGQRVA